MKNAQIIAWKASEVNVGRGIFFKDFRIVGKDLQFFETLNSQFEFQPDTTMENKKWVIEKGLLFYLVSKCASEKSHLSFILRLETIQIYLTKRLNGRAADQKKAALVAGLF